uniref:Uncharacterized protein n=1 Tax=Cyprinus carpio carpio TaxID=630221 RepID=A0A8C1B2J8_CYPCA
MDLAVNDLKKSLNRSGLKEVSSLQQCHFLLFFCPIISRAGTDIDAAVTYINQVKASSLPVIMVVLHYTFDKDKLTQDSNSVIKSEGISAVDCLFYENGLLKCQKNTNAINKIAKDSKSEKRTLYYCLNHKRSRHPSDQCAEDDPLIPDSSVPQLVQRRTICGLSKRTVVFIAIALFALIVLAIILGIFIK